MDLTTAAAKEAQLYKAMRMLSTDEKVAALRGLADGKPWIFVVRHPQGYVTVDGMIRERVNALGMLTDAIEGVHAFHRHLAAEQTNGKSISLFGADGERLYAHGP